MSSSNPFAPNNIYRSSYSAAGNRASTSTSAGFSAVGSYATSSAYPSSQFPFFSDIPHPFADLLRPQASAAYDPNAQGAYNDSANAAFDAEVAAQQSVYTPEAASTFASSNRGRARGKARTTVLRKGGGEIWEDQSLLEWDPRHFRLFVGDLGNDVSDETLAAAFSNGHPSFVKAKVVRDKFTTKSKGYGFVSYSDPEDFMKAWKEMNGQCLSLVTGSLCLDTDVLLL
jgi:hypothetical protein